MNLTPTNGSSLATYEYVVVNSSACLCSHSFFCNINKKTQKKTNSRCNVKAKVKYKIIQISNIHTYFSKHIIMLGH